MFSSLLSCINSELNYKTNVTINWNTSQSPVWHSSHTNASSSLHRRRLQQRFGTRCRIGYTESTLCLIPLVSSRIAWKTKKSGRRYWAAVVELWLQLPWVREHRSLCCRSVSECCIPCPSTRQVCQSSRCVLSCIAWSALCTPNCSPGARNK